VAWADKFRAEQTARQIVPRSWVLDVFRHARLLQFINRPLATGLDIATRARLSLPVHGRALPRVSLPRNVGDVVWYGIILAGTGYFI
jgi:NitT/TauT family transport system permease protein